MTSLKDIKNIYCVGRNYELHAKELNNKVPTKPMIFSKPTHSTVEANGQEILFPGDKGSIHYEVELVIHIGQDYIDGITVDEIVDKMAIGIDFTLRDVQSALKEKGHPWLLAKGFPNSALLSPFIDFSGAEDCKRTSFALLKNGEQVQIGNISDMIFNLQIIIDYIAKNFGLGKGDIIFTGTPEGVGEVADNDEMQLKWGENILGGCRIILAK
ncbi:fumarylacetoacetate hydrolase family protein [Desulfuribacillus alkaliarsenatis]|uniref:fumarylacetoacetate hydrolase family protein n=1 Tax=Desulfuribacillus alkaliarsenatis TaxID=766136 RepID=UPI001FE19C94|nr:fumarylacetoacetate hydrolase family protein [Desulfuribacillus alkaliarsenatis]